MMVWYKMSKNFFVYTIILSSLIIFQQKAFSVSNPLRQDVRTREIKYQYNVEKKDILYQQDKEILNLTPSGLMTVEEYEKASEYKDVELQKVPMPEIKVPSDFKYIPKPLYKIVKFNEPAGAVELSLGEKLYKRRMLNTLGITSPDFTKMAYSAVYYYPDSASVASDIFVIPLDTSETNLNRILKANIAQRNTTPLISTQKRIDNFATFRSLTPVDFSIDGTKLLVKEKIGSSEDGIWRTTIKVYDFTNKTDYDLSEIRDAITYFWTEYQNLPLEDKRWDIYPLGFDEKNTDRILVQAYAYTGEKPVFLGTWSIDCKGEQSRLVSFNIDYKVNVSANGYKVVPDGVEDYTTVENEEKALVRQSKYIKKEHKKQEEQKIRSIKEDYKYQLKELQDEVRAELRDNRKLQSYKGSTEDEELQKAYEKYLEDRWKKDIEKTTKQIDKTNKQIEKIDKKIETLKNELNIPQNIYQNNDMN